MKMQAALHPNFLRLPGGNYLEGNHINERYEWKKTLGPLVDRPTHPSPWGYHSTDGMGLLEMLYWCEDLHIHSRCSRFTRATRSRTRRLRLGRA